MGIGLIIEALVAAKQYAGGNTQPGGTLGHRNLLGLMSHFAVMPAFSLLLAGRRTKVAAMVVLAGAIVALAGGGRATVGLYAIGLVVTIVLSIRHKGTGRKSAMAGAAVLALLLAAPVMLWSIDRRSEAVRASSDQERSAMVRAARMIIADYPLGVGPNQYLIVANIGGYSSRADVAWNEANRAAPVHNTYYLVTAELGFLGLLGFVTVFFSAISLGLRSFKRLPSSERSDLAVGLTATLIVAAAHLAFEWAFATYYVQYVLAMSMGTLVGVTASLRQKSKSMKTSKTAAPAELVSRTG